MSSIPTETLLKTARGRQRLTTEAYQRAINNLPASASARDIQAVTARYESSLSDIEGEIRSLEQRLPSPASGRHFEINETPTYHRDDATRSWVTDAYRARTHRDAAALARLERNNHEAIIEAEERGVPLRDAEGRALNSSTTTGGDFLPPIWAGSEYASVKRARRVLSQLMQSLPLPPSGETITIPRMTAGASVAAQQDNQNLSNTDPVTAPLTVPVCSLGAFVDLSRQIIERSSPGLDQLVFRDLFKAYSSKIETYAISGIGSSGQPTGLLNQSGVNSIVYSDGSPSVHAIYPKLMDAVRQVTEAVFEPTVGYVMTARRLAWFLASQDANNRPLVVPNGQGPFNAFGTQNPDNASFLDNLVPAAYLAGIPVYVSELLPKTHGVGTDEDVIVSGAFAEGLIWEDTPRTFTFDDVGSASATIRCAIFGYAALTWGRYPAASSVITGSGLVSPNF